MTIVFCFKLAIIVNIIVSFSSFLHCCYCLPTTSCSMEVVRIYFPLFPLSFLLLLIPFFLSLPYFLISFLTPFQAFFLIPSVCSFSPSLPQHPTPNPSPSYPIRCPSLHFPTYLHSLSNTIYIPSSSPPPTSPSCRMTLSRCLDLQHASLSWFLCALVWLTLGDAT